jgi:endonuclease/exonuclease/phosphatase family metal-dependent hydrolase
MNFTEGRTFALVETFRVATYNVENYLDDTTSRCCVKSAASKAKVRECIRALHPDVLALQEMGSVAALLELRAALQAEGLDFPHWEHVTGSDANVHVAILSRFPFSARRPHTDDSFELGRRRFRVRRGFAEVGVQVNPGCQFTLLAAHLKSKKMQCRHPAGSGLAVQSRDVIDSSHEQHR